MSRGRSNRGVLSHVYAIESVNDRRVYIGVTAQPLRLRVADYLHSRNLKHPAREIVRDPAGFTARVLEAGVAWADREKREDEWNQWYRDSGWTVVNRLNTDRGWQWANAATTREMRQERGHKAMSAWTSEMHAEAARASNRRQYSCDECPVISNAGGMATHQKGSGHRGSTEIAPSPPT